MCKAISSLNTVNSNIDAYMGYIIHYTGILLICALKVAMRS